MSEQKAGETAAEAAGADTTAVLDGGLDPFLEASLKQGL